MSETWAEQACRPGGTVYRARKSPRVVPFGGDHDDGGFLVTRTHDVDVALALVSAEWSSYYGGSVPTPRLRWVRLVPWDDWGGYDSAWIDVLPGEKGATPAVEFRA